MMLRAVLAPEQLLQGSEDNGAQDGETQQVRFSTHCQIGSAPCGASRSSLGSVLHNIML